MTLSRREVSRILAYASLGALFLGAVPAGAADTTPAVRLVATGGTISNRDGGRLTADELIAAIPAVTRYATPEYEQFSNTASSALTMGQYLELARRLNALFVSRADLGGIVVTCGTDTLEELAYILHLNFHDERPVVVVGSMRNPSTVGYEGAANLLAGFRVAAAPESKGKGVLVVLNDEINSAREATKTDAVRLQTFQSRPAGVLGVVDGDRVVYYRATVKRHTARSEFDVASLTALPRVDVALAYQDAPGDVIRAMVDAGAKGIVLAAAGAGASSDSQAEALQYAASKGVAVVTATRTGSGRVASSTGRFATRPRSREQEAALRGSAVQGTMPVNILSEAFVSRIGAEDLTPVKARLLLMLALTHTKKATDIQRMFEEY
jgi:L-asparaginase